MKTSGILTSVALAAAFVLPATSALSDCFFDFTTANEAALEDSHWKGKEKRIVGNFPYGPKAESSCEENAFNSAARLAKNGRPLPDGTTLVIECRGKETTLGVVDQGRMVINGLSAAACR